MLNFYYNSKDLPYPLKSHKLIKAESLNTIIFIIEFDVCLSSLHLCDNIELYKNLHDHNIFHQFRLYKNIQPILFYWWL